MINPEIVENELAPLMSTLLSSLDEGIFFGELSRFFKKIYPGESIRVFKAYDDGRACLVSENGAPLRSGEVMESGKSLASYIIKTKRAYYSNSVQRDPLFSTFENIGGINSELGVPVMIEGVIIASIHIQSNNADKTFSQDDVIEVMGILNKLEQPVRNMKLYLSAKNLNEALMKKIEEKERELKKQKEGPHAKRTSHLIEKTIIGNSIEIKEVISIIGKVAPTDSSILIQGKSGTGKELVAQKIHCNSLRKESPYVVVNCGALQDTLLESELFGHEKGSFTGAINTKVGLVEMADGGTLFLDEVGELSPAVQTKLLRFLQEGEAYRVGGRTPYRVNVRILSATNKDLKKEVDEGRFREDLYYRLNTIKIEVPSLKERGNDIQILAENFLNQGKINEDFKSLTPSAIKVIMDYDWPGNIRELQNAMERAYIMSEGKFIDDSHFPEQIHAPCEEEVQEIEIWQEMTLSDLEKRHIIRTLDHLGGNKTKTAKTLGITVKTLYNKLHSYNMIETRE
ncbi:MAG: sigma-54-dependent Fis family transcriptional regulator [Bacteriovoracaceae bacterium]|jgi:Nif-specific regulatory protein|nr:sigma-54-dependent Fis family transcriptional regulator [Bacteriovoracaceae bacterium]